MREAVVKCKVAVFFLTFGPEHVSATIFRSSFSLLPVVLEYRYVHFTGLTGRRLSLLPRHFCGERVAWEEPDTRIETYYVEIAISLLCTS
jgi:hypothetical protein